MSSLSYSNSHAWQGILAIVIACFFWGTTGTAASFTPDVSPLAIGAFAMGGGAVLLVLFALRELHDDLPVLRISYRLMLIGGLGVAIYPLTFYSSMRLSGVAVGTVVSIASAPFFTVLLESLISKKAVSKQWLVSFVIGAVGITFLTLGKDVPKTNSTVVSLHYLGVILGLVAGLSYALYSWAAKGMIEQGVHSKSAMASMFGLAAAVLLPSLLITGENLFSTSTNLGVAVYMAVVPMFLGYVLFGYGLKFISASQATLITLLEPAIATLMAVVVVGERINSIGWFGMGLIVLCLFMQMPKPARQIKMQAAG
ncbi:DMT family transporter [Litoribrevibacter albus]|uniref:Membrane protein n=1 Tax=Litoribrevibacter albus TaxID=1473156 RepID=A0AA37S6N8_9GAMM|nr:EamA family transporter [Litoribrevibacter albus]GLQ29977.1 membrane protein [Litoribrevibacter albus]